jgi:quinol monooxygenase YgiN
MRWQLSLLTLALFCIASASWAQPVHQYVVVYVEFQPQQANRGKHLVDSLAHHSLQSSGVISFSAVREIGRDNRFVLVEQWSSEQAYQDYKASSIWTRFLTRAQPLLAAPLDERPGNLIE